MTYKEYISQFEVFDSKKRKKGYHRHHIVPRSQQTEPDNRQVYLLPSQHLWAHILYDRENGTKTADFLLALVKVDSQKIASYEDCLFYDQVDKNHRVSQSEKMKGEGNPMYGQTHSDETKKTLHDLRLGTHMTEETKKAISDHSNWKGTSGPMFGKHHKKESLKKISEHSKKMWALPNYREKQSNIMKGEGNPMYGKHRTDEVKKKLAEIRLGTHWWNNGEISKQSVECPGEGWIPGRVKKAV